MRKMIIIGSSNNFNELGLVRSFGVNGIKPYGIIICKKKQWKKEFKNAMAHTLIFKGDIIPAIIPVVSTIKKWIKIS